MKLLSNITPSSAAAIAAASVAAFLPIPAAFAGGDQYTLTNLGTPPGADTTTAVRMNNLGHVVGYSIYYGQGEPSTRPWVWTPAGGFMVLPPPPNMFLGGARAMDISDTGIIAGDGGFDAGIAWRYQDGVYETFGAVGGMPVAYLGAINDAGDVAGTARNAQITTEDEVFLDVNGGGTLHLTPGNAGGRASDVNNVGQVCGYSQGFEAFIWDETNGFQPLGTAGLAHSFANDMNDLGQVVGYARSASGNTVNSWIYTPGSGQEVLPERGATAINNLGHVVGTLTCCGPDDPWIWTPQGGRQWVFDLFNYVAAGLSGPNARDINDAGQVLLNAWDNNAGGYRPVLLTPVPGGTGACCLDTSTCLADVTEAECAAQGGTYGGNGSSCDVCTPVGACCLTDGNCLSFLAEQDCLALAGTYQGDGSSCTTSFGGCAVLEVVGCNLNGPGCWPHGSIMEFPVTCDEPVLIRVGSYSVYTGTGTLLLTFVGDPCAAACPGDGNGDGRINVIDLLGMLGAWGTSDPRYDIAPAGAPDGTVNVQDLLMLFGAWGPCP